MKKVLAIACLILSGYVSAQVAHTEDPNIVGTANGYGDDICFNNDGAIVNTDECDLTAVTEGYVYAAFTTWFGGSDSGINGCGVGAVDPVSSATCSFTQAHFATCTPNQYVLVQTTRSGHYFALRAGATCGVFTRPDAQIIFPCLSTDAFDPVAGCVSTTNPPQISVEAGFIKLDSYGTAPPDSQCSESAHHGRMIVDSVNGALYVCTQAGWKNTLLN